tara:strand:- start:865 stop:1365 length:501 start_codon:yes stop_codon:yes gene_type:complete
VKATRKQDPPKKKIMKTVTRTPVLPPTVLQDIKNSYTPLPAPRQTGGVTPGAPKGTTLPVTGAKKTSNEPSYRRFDKGGKITKEMVDAEDRKVKNSANANARRISNALKSGISLKSSGFPKKMTAAERKSLENSLAQTQKVLSSKGSYRDVGTSYSKGGKVAKYKK